MPRRPALFDQTDREKDHAWYGYCRDHRTKAGIRRALCRIWNECGDVLPEAPEQFVSEFRRDFPARSWELYILNYLARAGATLQRSPRVGPDFCATLPNVGRFWVECVVPGHGTGDDAVRNRYPGQTSGGLGPSTAVALRYVNVITDKIAKIKRYREKGIVLPTEPVLIALNQGAIDLSEMHDHEVPLIVRVLFGIGEAVIIVDPYAQTSHVDVPLMPNVKKRSGSEVATTIFLGDASAPIAGVVFARRSVFNLFPIRKKRLYLAHNPEALAPLPIRALPFRGEMWVDGEHLAHAGVASEYGALSKRRRWPR